MDIFISYGRIQMLYPKLKFMAKASVYKIAALLLFSCCLVNIPTIISRQNFKVEFKIDSNATTSLYTFGKISDFSIKLILVIPIFLIILNQRCFKLYHKQDFRDFSVHRHHPAWPATRDSRDITQHLCHSSTQAIHRSQEQTSD